MILRNLAVVCLGIVWFNGVCGASYSQVYVNNGLSGYQLPTLTYGAPGTPLTSQQQQNAPPVGSAVPYPQPASFNPCVLPLCVTYPNQAYQPPYTPVNKARVIYNTPNNAVLVAPNVPAGYEYSYVVYDDTNPATPKFQRQWSSVPVPLVQGPYSYPQPIHPIQQPHTSYGPPKVQYTPEDLKGFNAVVKNYLPAAFPGLFPNYKPIVLIQADPCEDPPVSNSTKNETKSSDKPKKKGDKVDPKSFGIEDFDDDPLTEETTTTATSTTTTEQPTTASSTTTLDEKAPKEPAKEVKGPIPEEKETITTTTTTTETSKTEDKPSEDKTKPKAEPEVSEPDVAASNTYANTIRCIQRSMKSPGQGGTNPLTYIISPFTPC